MEAKSAAEGVKARQPYRKKKTRKARGLRDFKTHTVRQSYAEVIFWALVFCAPLVVFVHPIVGFLVGCGVAYKVSRKNLYMFCVNKDTLKVHKGRVGYSCTVPLKDIASVEVELAVRGDGIDEGCEPGEGVVTVVTTDGKRRPISRVLRAEALRDVIIRRRDFVPDHRYRRPVNE